MNSLNNSLDNIFKDRGYLFIVEDILNNQYFTEIKRCKHHGMNRLDHSLRVSYYSYLLAKKLGLNAVEIARGGLLHDFFVTEDLGARNQKFSMFFHPYVSLKNASYYFDLTDREKDIIITHMFPNLPHRIPRYMESWIVSLVDKIVATYEFYCSYGKNYVYKLSNMYVILLILFRW